MNRSKVYIRSASSGDSRDGIKRNLVPPRVRVQTGYKFKTDGNFFPMRAFRPLIVLAEGFLPSQSFTPSLSPSDMNCNDRCNHLAVILLTQIQSGNRERASHSRCKIPCSKSRTCRPPPTRPVQGTTRSSAPPRSTPSRRSSDNHPYLKPEKNKSSFFTPPEKRKRRSPSVYYSSARFSRTRTSPRRSCSSHCCIPPTNTRST